MGGVLNACKSTLSKTVRSTPETINETHLEDDNKAYQHQREFEDAFLHNTEDLIQEITTNSQWQHHETRYLLSQFRKLGQKKDATNLTTQQFTQFLPILLKSFINIKDEQQFQQNKFYAKWLRNFIKIFSTNNDQITFQSFANTLSTACRGEDNEKAKLLFEIFDIDGDGTFNENELDLFLYYVLNIDCIDNGHNNNNTTKTEGNDTDTNTNPNNFDINKIIIKSKFVDYIQELISPPPKNDKNDKKEVKEDDKTVTNGQNSRKHDDDNNDEPPQKNKDEHKDDNKDENKDIKNNGNSSSKSSEKLDSEWEKLPLKKENKQNSNDNDALSSDNEDMVIANIDFLANMSIADLKNADDATLLDILKTLFKDKLFKKNKLKQKVFIPFASKSINFDNLFQSFMIIPTRDDEKKIIKHLMQSTEMTLGASWFVINKEWWDKWCSYTGYNIGTGEKKQNGDGIMDASEGAKKRALRPIKISNRELLDGDSYFTVLKKSLQENNEFILLPCGAWEQLVEWYGGGPSIERFVICTDKQIRMKVINYEMDKLKYEYEQQILANSEAMKKKKKKNKKKDEKDKDNNNNNNDDTDTDDNDTDKNGIFDIDKFNKEFPSKLQELSFNVHPDTLRIDLHPIYCNFVEINEKNEISDHSEREFSISRYATLPELYINICARIGYQIRDIDIPKRNYNAYLQHKLDIKTIQRENDKNKKKDKKKDKNKENDFKLPLPPRMWTVIRPQRGRPSTDRLLYPVPKLKKKDEEKKTNEKDAQTTSDKPDTNCHTNPTDEPIDNIQNTDPNNPNNPTDDSIDQTNNEDEEEDEIDLQTIGLESGVYIAIEFAHKNKKKGGILKYNLRSAAEDLVCEPEIDDSWLEFAVDDNIDGRDRWGKWYEAVIIAHKKPKEPFPKKPKLSKAQEKDIKMLEKLEGIFIHYKAWEEKWDEWIFITPPDTICSCRQACTFDKLKHRLAPPKTQSKYREERKRGSGHYGGGGGRYSGNYGGGWGRQRESIRGAPSTAGCVGLVNLGNTCFMNSIIQCVSNTPHFRTFFTSGQYKPDINKSNPLGLKGELANEFSKLLSDIWSGDYKTVAPRSLKRALSKFAPQFSGWQQHDSHEFLAFLLDGLHEDLNLVKSKPYTDKIESQGRTDEIVADLSWKIYLKRNKSKIVDLFQAQQKSHVICPDCNRNSITFDTYMYLSVPIVGHSTKSLVVDIFHRKCSNAINKPIRHVFHVNKYQKVRDLAKMVASVYNTKEQFVLFYENWNMKVAREYEHNLMLGMVPNREALACYVLKDWNKIVSPSDIKKKKLSLMLAKLCHSAPPKTVSNGSPLFGMPFVVSFLNIHTRREVHKVIYERLFMWIGSETLSKKPPSFVSDNNNNNDDEQQTETETKDNEEDNEKDEDINEEDEEKLWDEIFENLPYKLRLVPYKHYSFYNSSSRHSAPEEIPIDDVIFESKIRTKDIDIIIEWNHVVTYNKIKLIVNKVVVDKEYSEWKKQKQIQQQRTGGKQEALTLDDCINAYVAQETLGENDLWYCSECKKHEKANKKLDLWSFPEILIIHLKRFQVLGIGRFGRGEKINTFVDCPIRGLDLTQYVINDSSTAPIYDLYAVSCHSGSCGGGHYTAYALNAKTDRWYYFNDSSVRPAKESDIISSSSYVLFYKKCH